MFNSSEYDPLYKQAVSDIKLLVEDVLEQCVDFADQYNYEKEWVFERFRTEFNRVKRKF